MTFMDKAYTLRTEVRGDGKTSYLISVTDGLGELYDLEGSEAFYIEFRQMERKNRNLQQSDWRHQETSGLWDETLYNRAFKVPKSVEELIFDEEGSCLRSPPLRRLVFPKHGEDGGLYYAVEGNPGTRAMYANLGITALPCAVFIREGRPSGSNR